MLEVVEAGERVVRLPVVEVGEIWESSLKDLDKSRGREAVSFQCTFITVV